MPWQYPKDRLMFYFGRVDKKTVSQQHASADKKFVAGVLKNKNTCFSSKLIMPLLTYPALTVNSNLFLDTIISISASASINHKPKRTLHKTFGEGHNKILSIYLKKRTVPGRHDHNASILTHSYAECVWVICNISICGNKPV